jgi:tetratricopeptide (TPR) repeat protein
VESLLKHLAEGPDPAAARVSLARLYHAQGRLAEAGRELEGVLAADSTNVRALKLVASIQGGRGVAGAVEVFAGRALVFAPEDAEARALLASGSLLAGDAAEALARADEALVDDAASTIALRVRAMALAKLERFDEAGPAFEALLRADGGSWEAWALYAAFLEDRKDGAGALRAFETAADLAPDRREGFEGLLRAARLRGDEDRMEKAAAALRRLGPAPAAAR